MSEEKKVSMTESDVAMDVDELMQEYDLETSKLRDLKGLAAKVTTVIAIAMSLFQFYTAGFGTLLSAKQRSLHIIFAFTLGFLMYPASEKWKGEEKDKVRVLDLVFIGLTILVFGYLFVFVEQIANKGASLTSIDKIFGIIAILLTLEVTRRAVGPELPIVSMVFLAYAKFGPYLPGLLAHRGFSLERIIAQMYLALEGILGIPLGVSATFVFMFILFGAFLDKTGVGKFFIDLAFSLTGHLKSGPAMTAVVASGLMGSISGSSVANTVTTGAFTIPLMKKTGYGPEFAGAVEATASTGGQIMPPVMGAAAFIMADFTGFAYIDIVVCAMIPAILYFFAVAMMVHLEASRLGLKGLPREELPKFGSIMRKDGYLLIPLVAIISLLVMQYTPTLAAFVAVIVSIVVAGVASLIKKDGSFGIKEILAAFEDGAKGAIGVACACACAGMIVGVVTMTGLGLRIAELIVTLARGNLLLTLFFTMIASIILGMGLPTTAKYIVLATMAVPAITKLGVNLMSAHLFILYFGVVADITPPVALAAYAGAGIAGANSMRTGIQAFKLAIAAFIVPYIFAVDPSLILLKDIVGNKVEFLPVLSAVPMIISAVIGIICLAGGVQGYLIDNCNPIERILLIIAALLLLKPGLYTDVFGIVVLAITYIMQKRKVKAAQV